jgi:predicted nucleotidyltransferase
LHGLFQLSGFELALEEALGAPVDVVTTDSLFEDIRNVVEREEMVVYEAR